MPGRILSSEKVSLSDAESSSSSESEGVTSSNGNESATKKRKATSAPTASETGSRDSANPTKRARISNPTAKSSSSSSEEDEDESSVEDTAKVQTVSTPKDSSSRAPSTHTSASSRTYHPPEGFSEIKRSSTTSHLQTLFAPTNLAGKQIWHITLPADIPITTLKEVDIEKAKSGARILSHHGVEFGFVMEAQNAAATKDGAQLLVASDGGATYSTIPDAFDATLRLQQSKHPSVSYSIPGHAQAGSSSTGVEGAARPTVPRAKEVRQQPPGLRTRFWPNGFEDAGLGDLAGSPVGKSQSKAKKGKNSATTSESSSSEESSEDESEEEL